MGEEGNTPKPLCIGNYNKSMGFVDVNDMTNSNSISCNMWKWPKKLFFQLLDPTILNTFINHKSYEGKLTHTHISHKNFQGVLSMLHRMYIHILQLQGMVRHLHEMFATFTFKTLACQGLLLKM
jgi:hypothetical protein